MKTIKHYVEIIYPLVNYKNINRVSMEVPERNPLQIKNDGFIAGFRFYDMSEVEIEGEILKGDKRNFSPTYYFGQRLSLNELTQKMPEQHAKIISEKLGSNPQIIKCDNGSYITDVQQGDLTYDEYLALTAHERINNTKVDRRILFIGIANILSIVEQNPFLCRETNEYEKWSGLEEANSQTKYRQYTIENNDGVVLKHTFESSKLVFVNNEHHIERNLDKYIPFKEIKANLELLYYDYPYIKEFVDKVLEMCQQTNGKLPIELMKELESQFSSSDQSPKLKLEKN